MVEHSFSLNQQVYREGVDAMEYLYIVMRGEFECTKALPRNAYKQVMQSTDLDREGAEIEGISKMRQGLRLKQFSSSCQAEKTEQLRVCKHSVNDIFGFQELAEGAPVS